jgi:hypothetical protein
MIFPHSIVIYPTAGHVFRGDAIDQDLKMLINKYNLTFNYRLPQIKITTLQQNVLFHDEV